MKKILLSFLFITIFSACSSNNSPLQFESKDPTISNDITNSAINDRLAIEAGIKKIVYHIGPVDLPANTTLDAVITNPIKMNFHVDEPLWITGFEPKVIDASGTTLPSDLLFQAIVANKSEQNLVCTEGGVGNPFVTANSVLTKINLPDGFGYPVLETDPLEANVILYNPTDTNYTDVFFELNVIAKEMSEFTGMKDVTPILLDADPCTHKPLGLEPNNFAQREYEFNLQNAGKIILSHGIMQKFASYIELSKNSEKEPFWRAEAMLDAEKNLIDLTSNPFEDANGISLSESDKLILGIAYNNTSTNWYKGASTAAMIYFAKD